MANSAAAFFLTILRAWDMCALGKYVLVTHWDDRKEFHLLWVDSDTIFTLAYKFLFSYVSAVIVMEAEWLLYPLRVPSSSSKMAALRPTHFHVCMLWPCIGWFFSTEQEHLYDSGIDFPTLKVLLQQMLGHSVHFSCDLVSLHWKLIHVYFLWETPKPSRPQLLQWELGSAVCLVCVVHLG